MTKYFGVSAAGERFKAQINRKGRVFYLGTYDDVATAARMADASALISAVWSNVPPRLNFADSVATVPEAWNEHQKNMMQFLRDNFREDEKTARREQAVALHTPDIVFEHFQYAERKLEDVLTEVRRVLADGKQALRDAAIKASEDDKLKDWQRQRIAELEQQLVGKKFVEDMAARQGGAIMRPMPATPSVLEGPIGSRGDLGPTGPVIEVPSVVIQPRMPVAGFTDDSVKEDPHA